MDISFNAIKNGSKKKVTGRQFDNRSLFFINYF
jgi:hypothetical protein